MTERTWIPAEKRDKLTRKQIAELFLRQDGRCPECGQKLQTKGHIPVQFIDEHDLPLWAGGTNELQNRGLVCRPCAKDKTIREAPQLAKSRRVRDKAIGAKKSRNPLPGSKASGWRHRMDGTWERR
jgi:5-methylcytosine-specific restriction protein A